MNVRRLFGCFILCLLLACEGDSGPVGPAGPVGPQGPQGGVGPQGPVPMLTQADLVGTWSGSMMVENASGSAFVSSGTRTITFNADGTYTSDIFTNGSGNLSGSFIVLGQAVAVTNPNPAGNPFVAEFGGIALTANSLNFILNVRPMGDAFQLGNHTVYTLSRV